MALRQVVFQIESNPSDKIDVHDKYPFAIIVSRNNLQKDLIYDHGDYILGVLNGTRVRDAERDKGLTWDRWSGKDYIAWAEEDEDWGRATGTAKSEGMVAVEKVLNEWAVSRGLRPEYVIKTVPNTNPPERGAYDSWQGKLP